MVKRLMAILMSFMMLLSSLSLDIATVVAKADEAECNHILTQENINQIPKEFWITHSTDDYYVGAKAFIGVESPAGCENEGWRIDKTEDTGFCMVCGNIVGEKQPIEKEGHSWETTLEPSCEQEGEEECIRENYTLVISKVGDIYQAALKKVPCDESRSVPALGHDYKDTIISPTCTEDGYTLYECQREGCGHSYEDESTPAIGHNWDEENPITLKKPTCTKEGREQFVCKNDETHTDIRSIPAIGHEWDEENAIIVKKPTCEESGEKQEACKNDKSHTRNVSIPALEHDYKDTVVKPSCEEKGYTLHECQREGCGHTYEDSQISPTGHNYKAETIQEANCEHEGTILYTCINEGCGKEYTETLPKLPHTGLEMTKEPTCVSYGMNEGTCGNCGRYIVEAIEPLGHDYKDTMKAPTCTEDGYTLHECQREGCGYSYKSDYQVKIGHDWDEENPITVKEPTCTEVGKTEIICKNDETHKKSGDDIPAIGHDWDEQNSTIVKKATCEENGEEEFVCKNDRTHTEIRPIPATGHSYKATVIDPTCTDDGYTLYECQNEDCEHSYMDEPTPAIGHDWDKENPIIVKEPTCTEAGKTKLVCKNDALHEKMGEDIPATGHKFVIQTEETVEPTCTEYGRNVYVCENCGDAFVETLAPIGHDIEILETIAPTCVNGTIEIGECRRENCGKIIVTEDDDFDYSVSFAGGLGIAGANGFYVEPVAGEVDTYYLRSHMPAADIVVNFAAVLANPDLFMAFITSTGHDFYNYSAESPYATDYVPATCDKDGYWTITCCREAEVPVAGTYDSLEDVETETRTCPYGETSEGHELTIINANSAYGHAWKLLDDENSKAPTCGEDGYRKYICLNDHAHTYTEKLPATGEHKYTTEHVEATCTTPGKDVYTCTVCGDAYEVTTTPAKGHNYVVTNTVAATCTAEGYDVYTCTECDDTYNQVTTPAKGHSYAVTGTVAATCTTEGYDIYTCDDCDATYNKVTTPAKGHSYAVTGTVAATCTTEGYDIYTCDDCDATYNKVTTPAKAHQFTETGYVAPTCGNQGVRTFTCTNCEITYNSYEPALGHNYGKVNVIKPTCTSTGYTIHTCTNPGCTDSYTTDETDKVPHVLAVVDQKAPTCAEDGFETRACANCEYTETKVLPATGNHVYDNAVTKAATCTEDGVMTYTCQGCDGEYTEVIPAMGHNYGDVQVVEATCTENGYTTYTCTNPGCTDSYQTDVTDKVPHVLSVVDQKAPTCAEDGFETSACANCEYTETKVLPATGNHVYDNAVTKAATCTEDGVMTYTCQGCEGTYTEVIPAIGHNFGKEEIVEPTCTEAGYTVYTCTNPGCTDSYQTDETDKVEHVLSVTDQKNATCTEKGYVTKACANCEYTETTELAATDHIFDDEGVITSATCQKEGYTTYTCAVCGEEQVIKTAEKIAHVYKSEVTIPAELNKDGIVTEGCVHCGKQIVVNEIDAIKSVKLSAKKFVFNNRKMRPTVTVKDTKGNVISSKYYTVTYANNKKVGTATVTVKFKGLYAGTVTKSFKIIPRRVEISKVTAGKKSITVTWGKVLKSGNSGYKLQYSTNKNFKKAKTITIKKRSKYTYTINGLKSGKRYYVRIRTYKKVSGKNYYGNWYNFGTSVVCK